MHFTRTHLLGMSCLLAAASVALVPHNGSGQLTRHERAELVLRLLPAPARPAATVILRDGETDKTYRAGAGPFVCVSDASSRSRLSMVCHHRVLDRRLRFEQEFSKENELQGDALREALCQAVARLDLEVPDGAMEITASLTVNEDGTFPAEMTVYHLMWFPGETTETIGIVDGHPGGGRPWLHRAGTCGAHVMWSEMVRVAPEGI